MVIRGLNEGKDRSGRLQKVLSREIHCFESQIKWIAHSFPLSRRFKRSARNLGQSDYLVFRTGRTIWSGSNRIWQHLRRSDSIIRAFGCLADKIETERQAPDLAHGLCWVLVYFFLPLPLYRRREHSVVDLRSSHSPPRICQLCQLSKYSV